MTSIVEAIHEVAYPWSRTHPCEQVRTNPIRFDPGIAIDTHAGNHRSDSNNLIGIKPLVCPLEDI